MCNRETLSKFFDIVKDIESEITNLCDYYFKKTDNFKLVTSGSTRRFPIYSFTSKNHKVENINLFMNELNIMTSCGKFHCNKFIKDNVLRISFLHYNTLKEVDQVFKELFEFDKSHPRVRNSIVSFFIGQNDSSYTEYTLSLSDEFKRKYDHLSLDVNYNSVRYRRYSLISIETMKLIGTKFYQSEEYNKTDLGGVIRNYKEINIGDNSCFHDIVKHFVKVVKQKSGQQCRYCTAHQIRVVVNNDSVTPVPEGIHQDGYSYVGILCVNRENIIGGVTKIYSLENEEMYSTILKSGEMIILNDRDVKHYVSNIIRAKNDRVSFRDILVLTTVF